MYTVLKLFYWHAYSLKPKSAGISQVIHEQYSEIHQNHYKYASIH